MRIPLNYYILQPAGRGRWKCSARRPCMLLRPRVATASSHRTMSQTAAAMSPGISGTQENMAVTSAVATHTPTLARSWAAEPGGAASNRRRQPKSRTRLAYSAKTRTVATASPRDLWIAMTEFAVTSRKPRDAAAADEPLALAAARRC